MTSKRTILQKPFISFCFPLLILLFTWNLQAQTKSAAEFILVAQAATELAKAADLMNDAAAQYPNDFLVLAYHGMYTGMLAGEYQDQDFMESGRLVTEAFQILDKAVSMDSTHVQARLFRGTLRVDVPESMKAEALYWLGLAHQRKAKTLWNRIANTQ